MFKFNLRDKVKDQITGFTGVITTRQQYLASGNRYCVAPSELKDGLPQEDQTFDECQLDLIEESSAVVVIKDFKFSLGDKIKDKVTGYEGILMCNVQYHTGCNRVGIQSKNMHEGKPVNYHYFDEGQMELSKAKVIKSEKKDRRTGGSQGPLGARP